MAFDAEPFRAELDTRGFRSQLTGVGARDFVRNLRFAAEHVTAIVWLRSERSLCACGAPLSVGDVRCLQCCPMPSEGEQRARAEREAA